MGPKIDPCEHHKYFFKKRLNMYYSTKRYIYRICLSNNNNLSRFRCLMSWKSEADRKSFCLNQCTLAYRSYTDEYNNNNNNKLTSDFLEILKSSLQDFKKIRDKSLLR